MTALSLLMLLALSPVQTVPAFTQDEVRQAVACADRSSDRCAPPQDRAATIDCLAMAESAGVDAVDQCLAGIMDRCVGRWEATTSEMNTRVIVICAAQSRAALREAADDWLERADGVVPEAALSQYRGLRTTVPSRADQDVMGRSAAGINEAAARTGVWTSFVLFLWREQWRYPDLVASL